MALIYSWVTVRKHEFFTSKEVTLAKKLFLLLLVDPDK